MLTVRFWNIQGEDAGELVSEYEHTGRWYNSTKLKGRAYEIEWRGGRNYGDKLALCIGYEKSGRATFLIAGVQSAATTVLVSRSENPLILRRNGRETRQASFPDTGIFASFFDERGYKYALWTGRGLFQFRLLDNGN